MLISFPASKRDRIYTGKTVAFALEFTVLYQVDVEVYLYQIHRLCTMLNDIVILEILFQKENILFDKTRKV